VCSHQFKPSGNHLQKTKPNANAELHLAFVRRSASIFGNLPRPLFDIEEKMPPFGKGRGEGFEIALSIQFRDD
jgi:hypothetical protein